MIGGSIVKKKVLFLLFLFLPFFVDASNIEDLELKWSIVSDVPEFSVAYITDNKIILKNDKHLYSYNKDGKASVSKSFIDSFSVLQVEDNKLILVLEEKIVLLNEDLEEIGNFNFDGILAEYYINGDSLLLFSCVRNDSNVKVLFYRFNFNLDVLNEDSFDFYGNISINLKDDKYIIEDSYDNLLYVDDDYVIAPMEKLDDGSFFVYNNNYFYKYDKNKKLIKTVNFEDSGIEQYKFYHYVLNNKIYVSSVSLLANTSLKGYYFYTIHLYLLDYDLTILKESTISNSTKSLKQYSPTDYYYNLYLNEGGIYLYDGRALYDRYTRISEDLSLTTVTSEEAVPENSSSTGNVSIRTKIRNAISTISEPNAYFSYSFSYIENSDSGYIVSGVWSRSGSTKYEFQNELIFLDEKFNVKSRVVVDEWSSIDETLYPEYSSEYPCIDKRMDSQISEYRSDYIVYVGNSASSSIIRIYDKKGNVIKDFSKDVTNIHMGPLELSVKDNAIFVGLVENFELFCPSGMKDSIDYYDDYYYEPVLVKQVLYYDFPYNIFTIVDGKGTITVSKSSEFSGNEIQFEVKPEDGYELKEVKVTDANGNVVVFTDYKFTMPSADVTIESVFVPENPDTSDIVFIIVLFAIGIFVVLRIKSKNKIAWLS